MRILSLDISTNMGWALLAQNIGVSSIDLLDSGVLCFKSSEISYVDYSETSLKAMLMQSMNLKGDIEFLIRTTNPDEVVIEQTNKGRSRYSQKLLEWFQLRAIEAVFEKTGKYPKFIDSSKWRSIVGLKMSKEDKKHNKQIRTTKGRGLIGKKHLAVRMVNKMYNLKLKIKHNDIADAILVGSAYLKGV